MLEIVFLAVLMKLSEAAMSFFCKYLNDRLYGAAQCTLLMTKLSHGTVHCVSKKPDPYDMFK